MSEGLRDMLANRRFAIPLIILLAFCFIGLILVGVVLILRPGAPADGTPVAQATATDAAEATEEPSSTPEPVASPTPRPSPTLVPMGTSVESESSGTPESTADAAGTPVDSAGTDEATVEATATVSDAAEATAPPPTEEELAETGIGWGLILISGLGLAMLVLVARRLRLAH
jgi:hypothetical protein